MPHQTVCATKGGEGKSTANSKAHGEEEKEDFKGLGEAWGREVSEGREFLENRK